MIAKAKVRFVAIYSHSSSGRSRNPGSLAILAAGLLASFALLVPPVQAATYTASGGFGVNSGAGGGQNSLGIAVKNSSGDIYVGLPLDGGSPGQIQRFSSTGARLGVNEIQEATVDATGGTFTLSFGGPGNTTEPIAFDASAGAATAALEAVGGIGPGNVSVAGGPGSAGGATPYVVTFEGALGGTDVSELTSDATNLTGGAGQATVSTQIQGSNGFGSGTYAGVALDQTSGAVYAFNSNEFGLSLSPTVDVFSSAGVPGSPFSVTSNGPGTFDFQDLATDSAGNVYYPNAADDTIQKFSPAGALLDTIDPTGEAVLEDPRGIKVDGVGDLYVVDAVGGGRLQKLSPAGAQLTVFATGSVQTVGLDAGTGRVFAGEGNGESFHVVAYNPDGTQLADFGLGEFANGPPIPTFRNFIAVNEATGVLYATDYGTNSVKEYVFVSEPTVTTGIATAITSSGATLNATVNPNEQSTSCQFRYGPTAAYGSTAPCVPSPGAGSSPVGVSAVISSLSPNTTYHFSVRGLSTGGTADGTDQTFTTSSLPPAVADESVSGIAQTAATVTGTVNPNGNNVTECHVDYGPTGAYGSQKACAALPGNGGSPVSVSAALSGLIVNTLYHYRVVAANGGGITSGNDHTFTTLADTCATNAALCPPLGGNIPPGAGGSVPPPAKPLRCKKGFKKKQVKGKAKCVRVKKHKKRRH